MHFLTSYIGRVVVAVALVSCGGRVGDGVTDASAEASAPPKPLCSAGDPPALVATGLPQNTIVDGLATDGSRLYVQQDQAPLLWSVDILGGPLLPLYGLSVSNTMNSGQAPLLLANGGVYFDEALSPDAYLSFVPAAGGPSKILAKAGVMMFDWSGTRGFTPTSPTTLSTVALNGSVQPFLTVTDSVNVAAMRVTERFVHVILTDASQNYTDRRVDPTTKITYDEVPLDVTPMLLLTGPSALCGVTTDGQNLSCLADDQSVIEHISIPSLSPPIPVYVDASWIYVEVHGPQSNAFSRYALSDGHEQVLMLDAYPQAVTSLGDCIYAALYTAGSSNVGVWRLSAP